MAEFEQRRKGVVALGNRIRYHFDMSYMKRGKSFRVYPLLQCTEEPTMLHLDDGAPGYLEQLKTPCAGYDEIVVGQDPSRLEQNLTAIGQGRQNTPDFRSSFDRQRLGIVDTDIFTAQHQVPPVQPGIQGSCTADIHYI